MRLATVLWHGVAAALAVGCCWLAWFLWAVARAGVTDVLGACKRCLWRVVPWDGCGAGLVGKNYLELKELKPPGFALCINGLDALCPLLEIGAVKREDVADLRSLDCGWAAALFFSGA